MQARRLRTAWLCVTACAMHGNSLQQAHWAILDGLRQLLPHNIMHTQLDSELRLDNAIRLLALCALLVGCYHSHAAKAGSPQHADDDHTCIWNGLIAGLPAAAWCHAICTLYARVPCRDPAGPGLPHACTDDQACQAHKRCLSSAQAVHDAITLHHKCHTAYKKSLHCQRSNSNIAPNT